jgi:hypothetical protein
MHVCVCACVCHSVCRVHVFVRTCICIFLFLFVCVRATVLQQGNWWAHSLLREGYGKDKHWVLLGLLSFDSA